MTDPLFDEDDEANTPLTEEERAQIEGRIAILEIEHHDLDDVIARLEQHHERREAPHAARERESVPPHLVPKVALLS